MHKCRLVKEREHAVEVLKVVLEQRQGLGFRGQVSKDSAAEKITEDIGLPSRPLVIVNRDVCDHLLERIVPHFLVDPLNSFRGENRES